MSNEIDLPDYESWIQRIYESVLKPGDFAIDAGAHVGRHCIPMASGVAPLGKVFAFEPLPVCIDALRNLVTQNYPNLSTVVDIQQLALGKADRESSFVVAEDLLAYSGLRMREYDGPTRTRTINVHVKTIDGLFEGCVKYIRYIKIDAEGGEFDILQGAAKILRTHRPLVTFEFGMNSARAYEVQPGMLHRFLVSLDYFIFDVEGKQLGETEFEQSSHHQRLWDYVAIPRESEQLLLGFQQALSELFPDRHVGIRVQT